MFVTDARVSQSHKGLGPESHPAREVLVQAQWSVSPTLCFVMMIKVSPGGGDLSARSQGKVKGQDKATRSVRCRIRQPARVREQQREDAVIW